ncbi:unnamed protein product [Penicillium pancosmium]
METSEDAQTQRSRAHRRKSPVGLVGVGCVTHCLDDVRHGLRWAEETSPETYEKALRNAVQGSLRYEAEEILLYLLAEENIPALEQGWDIDQRGSVFGHEKLRFLDLACKDLDLVRWCLDHGAKIDDGKVDDWAYPCILQSAAKRGNVEVYKFLQSLGAQPGPHDLVIAVQRASINYLEDAKGLVRYFLDDLGWDVNREAPHGWGMPIFRGIGPEISGGDQITRLLLERGADPYHCHSGMDAFSWAEKMKNNNVLAVLEEWKEGKIPRIMKS